MSEGSVEQSPLAERPCFPIKSKAVDNVNNTWLREFSPDPEGFITHELELATFHDRPFADYLNLAFGSYQERSTNADRNAYLEGALYVNKILLDQGRVPRVNMTPGELLAREEEVYTELAEKQNTPSATDELARERIRALTNNEAYEPLARAIMTAATFHPARQSYMMGAAMSLFPRIEQTKQQKHEAVPQASRDDTIIAELEQALKEPSAPDPQNP